MPFASHSLPNAMSQTCPSAQPPAIANGCCLKPMTLAGTYGAFCLTLALTTEEPVDKPEMPDIAIDLGSILSQVLRIS